MTLEQTSQATMYSIELPEGALRTALSPAAYSYLAFCGQHNGIARIGGMVVGRPPAGEMLPLKLDSHLRAIDFRPKSEEVFAAYASSIRRFEYSMFGRQWRELDAIAAEHQNALAFSKDGELLAAGGMDGVLSIFCLAGGAPPAPYRLKVSKKPLCCLAFHPHSHALYMTDAAGQLMWLNGIEAGGGSVTCRQARVTTCSFLPPGFECYTVAVQGQASYLVAGGADQVIWLIDPAWKDARCLRVPCGSFVRKICFRHGHRLIVIGETGVALVDVPLDWRSRPIDQVIMACRPQPGVRILQAVEGGAGFEQALYLIGSRMPAGWQRQVDELVSRIISSNK